MAHEMLTMVHSAQEAAYMAILWDDITEAECEDTTCHLRSKVDAAWKKMHEVMYNHQLEYDWWLSDFLKEVEATLANMRDQIWTAVHVLTESEGMTFEDCLSLTLHILPLLPQIPVGILYETQILLTIAYCLESSVYRRWHPKQGGVSPFHKEVRASRTLTKVLGGIHCQDSEGVDHAPSPAISEGSAGSGGSQGSRGRPCSHSQSITSHHSRQSGSTQSRATKDDKESSGESEASHVEEDAPHEDEYAEVCRGDAEVLSNGQVASDCNEGPGRCPIQNTLSGVSHVFCTHEETDIESDHEQKIQSTWQKWCQTSPKEDTPSKELDESSLEEEQPTDEALCKRPSSGPSIWTQTSMPGGTRRLQKASLAGSPETPCSMLDLSQSPSELKTTKKHSSCVRRNCQVESMQMMSYLYILKEEGIDLCPYTD